MVERGRRPEVRTPPQQYAVPEATYWRYREKYRVAAREARAEAERKAYADWQASIRRQYSPLLYNIEWTDEGATITRKQLPRQITEPLQRVADMVLRTTGYLTTFHQRRAAIQRWRQDIRKQYPASQYDIVWTSTGADITKKPVTFTLPSFITEPLERVATMVLRTTGYLTTFHQRRAATQAWRRDIRRQYPAPKYRVEWTPTGANIYELVEVSPARAYKPAPTFADVQVSRMAGPGTLPLDREVRRATNLSQAMYGDLPAAPDYGRPNIAFIPHSVVEEKAPGGLDVFKAIIGTGIKTSVGFWKAVAKEMQQVYEPPAAYDVTTRYIPREGETFQEALGRTIVDPEAPVFKALEYYVFRHERAAEEKPIRTEWEKQLTTIESQERTKIYREIELEAEKGRAEGYTEPEIQAWIKTEQVRVESELLKWRGEQEPLYQKYISKWREQWRPASVAERILGIEKQIQTPSWYLPKAGILPGTTQERPLATVAGFVGSVESFVYGVESLVGIKTPRIPASPSGSVIGDIVGTVKQVTFWPETKTGYTSEMLEAYPKQYVGGGILGDIFTFWLVSKGVDKLIMQPAAASLKGSRIDTWLAKHSSWYYKRTGGLARQEVGMGKIGIPSYETGPLLSKSYLAGEMAWELHLTPRTGGVMLAVPAAVKEAPEKLLPTLWIRGGVHQHITGEGWAEYAHVPKKIDIPAQELTWKGKQLIQTQPVGFARYTHRIPVFTKTYFERGILPTVVEVEKGLLPLVTQAQVTRLGLIPYMGRTVTPIFVSAAPSSLSNYIFSGVSRAVIPVSGGKKVSWPSPTLPEISLDLKQKRKFDFGVTPGLELWRTLRFFESERVKRKERMVAAPTLKRPSRTALSETVFSDLDVGLELGPKEIVAQKPKEKAVAVSLLKTVLKTGTSWDHPDIPQPLLPELKRKERKKKREKRKKKGIRKKQWEKYEILYPVAGAKTVAEYIFSKRKK